MKMRSTYNHGLISDVDDEALSEFIWLRVWQYLIRRPLENNDILYLAITKAILKDIPKNDDGIRLIGLKEVWDTVRGEFATQDRKLLAELDTNMFTPELFAPWASAQIAKCVTTREMDITARAIPVLLRIAQDMVF